jgi:hypothetical protein
MKTLQAALGIVAIVSVLWDAFETLVLPRRVTRKFRLARGYYITVWSVWSGIARRLRPGKFRDLYLSIFGPLSLLFLFVLWATGLVFGFALVHRATGGAVAATGEPMSFLLDLYLSGTTFFTLGLGDVIPRTTFDRMVTVTEAGVGFGFLALIIGYLPILYQGFSRREITISLLDARAGSPPSASELMKRYGKEEQRSTLHELLREWERWSAQVLESHLSYPVLVYFRSQHDNQSWLGALTAILDTSALCIVVMVKEKNLQARLTFAMARHAVTDIAQALNTRPVPPAADRLPPAELQRLRAALDEYGLCTKRTDTSHAEADQRLRELRHTYEPYVNGLAQRLLIALPPWIPEGEPHFNWRTTAWERSLEGIAATAAVDERDDHR